MVESTEIDLSEFQEENRADSTGDDGSTGVADGPNIAKDGEGQATSTTENGAVDSVPQQGKKLVISDEYFQRVTQALIMRLRQNEETVRLEGTGLAGMRQRDLIQWYVSQQNEKNNYSSMEEAAAEVTKVKAIIESLIRREGHLIVVDDGRQAAADAGGAGQSSSVSRNDRILAVAPNYVID